MKPLIALIVGHGVEHGIIHQLVVIPVEGLAYEDELILQGIGKAAQFPEKVPVKTICHIQP